MAVIANPTPQMLREAEAAYHRLLMGQSAREIIDSNGEKVTFTAANQSKLAAYIVQLQQALNVSATQAPPRPAGFIF